ncbi:MAG: hypothetical protein K0B05_02590 [Bacteroidales bacterium]|nr:hypothetical protein [Bacteroidales bacterium]
MIKKPVTEKERGVIAAPFFFFLAAFAWFCFPGNYILYFQENQTLFLFTGEYLHKYLLKPGGPLEYIARFLEQFYAGRITGSVMVSVVLTLPAIMLYRINKRLVPENGFSLPLLMVPSLILMVMQTNYYHMMEYNLGFVAVLVLYLVFILYGRRLKFIVKLILMPLLYYLTGAYFMIFLGMYLVHNLFIEKGKERFVRSIFILGTAGFSFLLFWKIIFLQPVQQIILSPLPLLENPFYRAVFALLTAYVAFYPAISRALGGIRIRRYNRRRIYPVVTTLILTAAAVYSVLKIYNPQTARVVELEKHVFTGKFEEAARLHEMRPSRNLIGQYFYNYALSESDQLCDRLFFGRQDFSAGALVLPWGGEHLNRGGYFYYSVGLINEAHRWAYEEMVVYGYRPQNIKMLARTSLINEDFRMARKYLNILEKTLYYRKWAKEYKKLADEPELIKAHNDLGPRMDLVPENNFFIQFNEPQNNLPYLLEGNPENRRAIEYYLAGLLLSKKVEIIVNNIVNMEDSGYSSIPRHIEEAILVYYNSTGIFPDLGKLRMNRETPARFDKYLAAYLSARQNPATMREKMEKDFGNTFWYYFHFR